MVQDAPAISPKTNKSAAFMFMVRSLHAATLPNEVWKRSRKQTDIFRFCLIISVHSARQIRTLLFHLHTHAVPSVPLPRALCPVRNKRTFSASSAKPARKMSTWLHKHPLQRVQGMTSFQGMARACPAYTSRNPIGNPQCNVLHLQSCSRLAKHQVGCAYVQQETQGSVLCCSYHVHICIPRIPIQSCSRRFGHGTSCKHHTFTEEKGGRIRWE